MGFISYWMMIVVVYSEIYVTIWNTYFVFLFDENDNTPTFVHIKYEYFIFNIRNMSGNSYLHGHIFLLENFTQIKL